MAATKDESAKKKIKILSADGDNSDVFLAVNGKNCVIKRNEVVEIGPEFIEVLNNATIKTVIRDFDASGNKVEKLIEVPRYPYTMA